MIPKVELHVHLDGSARIETLKDLSNLDIEEVKKNSIAKDKCIDLNDYLTKFSFLTSVMQDKESLTRVAYELACDLKSENVIYAEIRFAPIKHTKKLTLEEVVESVLEGLRKVDIKTNLILCMMRGDSLEVNKSVIDLAHKYLNKGVVGIDLAGAEALYKTYLYKDLFSYANKLNIPFTIHAGEADTYESVCDAIKFGAKRIGHGINSINSKEVMDLIKDNNILLEICPTSNIQTNVVDTYANHPIKRLYDYGIKVSINTDNRTVSNTNLENEYEKVVKYLNFTNSDLIKMNKDAIESAFLSDIEKEELKNKYDSLI